MASMHSTVEQTVSNKGVARRGPLPIEFLPLPAKN